MNKYTLSEIGDLKNGLNFNKDSFGKGVDIVNVKQLYQGRYINIENLESIKEESIKNLNTYLLKEGDIIFARSSVKRSGAGQVAMIKSTNSKLSFSGFTIRLRIRDKNKFNPDYLNYLLRSERYRRIFQQTSTGTTISNISQDLIKSIEVEVPTIDYQNKVVSILSAFDDKIELNLKMNKTLEETAKTLFNSWFIDFDPVRAKADGRSTGLSKEISDLFPDSFEDSELGEIPKGWEVKALDEIAEFLNGLALQKYPEDEEYPRYPVLKIAQLREGSAKSQNVFSSNIPEEYIVRNGDYIFSWSGSLLAKFWLGGDVALNQHLFKVTSQNYPKWFFASWVEKHLDMFSSIASSKATTMGHIKRSDLKDAKTVVPPIELISSFGEYFSPLREKANLCFLENDILSELRDTLLPRLISGELQIPDAENLIEEAGI